MLPTSRLRCALTGSTAAAVTVLLLGLASCGTIPPQDGLSDAPTSGRTTAGPVAGPVAATTPASTPTRSPAPPSSPAADVWVGHFHGHEVRIPRGHGATMSFTFDDGPWPTSTQQVLDLLAQHHVHAVFCVIGRQARANPALVRREVAGGHELCDHSRDHDLFMARHDQAYVDAEVADGMADVQRAAPRGTKISFYRQPGGTWSPAVVRAMRKDGLDPLRWSDDPRDWSRPGSLAIVRRVVSHLHPGAVVLMHDGGGDRSESVEALRFLLGAVIDAGWRPVLAPHVHLSAKAAAKPQ